MDIRVLILVVSQSSNTDENIKLLLKKTNTEKKK